MLNIFFYLIIALIFNIAIFIFAYNLKTDKLTDLSYALSFIILILIGFFSVRFSNFNLILVLMVFIWALRLGIFLFIRIGKMKRDKRFDGIRESFSRFFVFWASQGITVWIILIPSLLFLESSKKITLLTGIGLLIWFTGLTIETFADLQKYKFNKKNKTGIWISTGLWKYSRHPNYFGEILCWIGIYLFVFNSLDLAQRLYSLISPLFIIIILLFFTGIPKLEEYAHKKWGKDKEYKEYKRKTSILIPWFNRE